MSEDDYSEDSDANSVSRGRPIEEIGDEDSGNLEDHFGELTELMSA